MQWKWKLEILPKQLTEKRLSNKITQSKAEIIKL